MITDELLHLLELKIKDLLARHDKLKQATSQLQNGKSLLLEEKETLMQKQQHAISQIETLVSRLKSIEDLP